MSGLRIASQIPRHFDTTPEDIQVLRPSRHHVAGTLVLNVRLQ
ncbi:hypothetical protein ACSNOH_01615 [Streptomyces sp. URMC 127]